jgi:hypothetical protein
MFHPLTLFFFSLCFLLYPAHSTVNFSSTFAADTFSGPGIQCDGLVPRSAVRAACAFPSRTSPCTPVCNTNVVAAFESALFRTPPPPNSLHPFAFGSVSCTSNRMEHDEIFSLAPIVVRVARALFAARDCSTKLFLTYLMQ